MGIERKSKENGRKEGRRVLVSQSGRKKRKKSLVIESQHK